MLGDIDPVFIFCYLLCFGLSTYYHVLATMKGASVYSHFNNYTFHSIVLGKKEVCFIKNQSKKAPFIYWPSGSGKNNFCQLSS